MNQNSRTSHQNLMWVGCLLILAVDGAKVLNFASLCSTVSGCATCIPRSPKHTLKHRTPGRMRTRRGTCRGGQRRRRTALTCAVNTTRIGLGAGRPWFRDGCFVMCSPMSVLCALRGCYLLSSCRVTLLCVYSLDLLGFLVICLAQ